MLPPGIFNGRNHDRAFSNNLSSCGVAVQGRVLTYPVEIHYSEMKLKQFRPMFIKKMYFNPEKKALLQCLYGRTSSDPSMRGCIFNLLC